LTILSFQTTQSVPPTNPGHSTPSKSYERLIDGKMTPDYEYFQQVLPPELARQILIGKSLTLTHFIQNMF